VSDTQSALKLKSTSCEVLARKRRQTEESQCYEEQEECFYGPGIAD